MFFIARKEKKKPGNSIKFDAIFISGDSLLYSSGVDNYTFKFPFDLFHVGGESRNYFYFLAFAVKILRFFQQTIY